MSAAVYRVFDSAGSLLYVGMSVQIGSRLGAHSSQTDWWPEAATVAITHCGSRDEALKREAEAIELERPRYNVRQERAHVAGDFVHAVFEVPTDLYEAFKRAAKQRDQTFSQEMRRLMREYLDDDESAAA